MYCSLVECNLDSKKVGHRLMPLFIGFVNYVTTPSGNAFNLIPCHFRTSKETAHAEMTPRGTPCCSIISIPYVNISVRKRPREVGSIHKTSKPLKIFAFHYAVPSCKTFVFTGLTCYLGGEEARKSGPSCYSSRFRRRDSDPFLSLGKMIQLCFA